MGGVRTHTNMLAAHCMHELYPLFMSKLQPGTPSFHACSTLSISCEGFHKSFFHISTVEMMFE